jgi:hypothetical protein
MPIFRMGHDPGGFRVWWRALTGSDETLENTYLMRMAGRFSRRVRGYARARGIPVVDCPTGQRKHDLARRISAKATLTQGCFWSWLAAPRRRCEMSTPGTKKPMPYVNHYSLDIRDPGWGHLTIKISGHPAGPRPGDVERP